MKITTWNINSVRLRLPIVLKLLQEESPDILCLQETKCPDGDFPHDAFEKAGYVHRAAWGMKGYNGVAILSRIPFTGEALQHTRCGQDDCRHLSVMIARHQGLPEFELHNVYLPAGGYEPDPIANPKFQHKLDFIEELTAWFREKRDKAAAQVLVGDLNVAPLPCDVWSHKQMLNVVSHTPAEVSRLTRLLEGGEWVDGIRQLIAPTQKLYTWWSYRAQDWQASDRGRRLDHIWVTAPLAPHLRNAEIVKAARGWERPSDHVPVGVCLLA